MKTLIKKIELENIVDEINKLQTDTILLMADHQVWSHYSKDIILEKIEIKKVIFWKAADGEKVKNITDFQNAVEFFLEKGIHRNAHLVVIGGGATSDFGGFVAATILRGIQWSIVPTTLLSMVDASIGGKVAINSKSGKNLIGAFHLPTNVWICSKFLETLPAVEKNSGMGEVLKYSFLDYTIYDLVIKKAEMSEIVDACAKFKEKLTQEDLKENGVRKLLNLGHSFGHAVEFIYNIPHGEAVMWGIALIFKLFGNEKNINDIAALKKALDIPGDSSPWFNKEFPIDKIMMYLSKDKKISALSSIDLVLIKDIGNAEVETKTFDEVQAMMEAKKMSLENSPYKVSALNSFDKEIVLPSSKSHSNRALIIGAIKGGNFKVHNVSNSSDVTNLVNCFKKIGLKMKIVGTSITFENSFPECEKDSLGELIKLQTGDGGTTNRFLIALLSRGKKEYHLFPTEKMSERPIEDLINPLKKLNVQVSYKLESTNDSAWVIIKGPASLNNTSKLEIDCQKSTQFATALMLAFSNRSIQFEFLNLHASEAYLKMTAQVITKSIESNSYTVPVDFSCLGYPIALAALSGRVLVKNCLEIDQLQADSALIEVLKNSGAQRSLSNSGLEVKKGTELKPISFKVSKAPDLFPTLIFLAAHIEGTSTFTELDILQFKESDRLMQMINIMKKFDVKIDYDSAGNTLKVTGQSKSKYKSVELHPARDHRIVMAAALFMVKNSGGSLHEVDCVEKSFPGFFRLLE